MVLVQHLKFSLKILPFFSVMILYFFSSRILCDLHRCIENGSRDHRWWGISIGSAIMAPKCQIHDHFGSNINDPFLSRKVSGDIFSKLVTLSLPDQNWTSVPTLAKNPPVGSKSPSTDFTESSSNEPFSLIHQNNKCSCICARTTHAHSVNAHLQKA